MRKPSIGFGFSSSSLITIFTVFFTAGHLAYFACEAATFLPVTLIVTLWPATLFALVVQVRLRWAVSLSAAAVPTAAKAKQARAAARPIEMRFMEVPFLGFPRHFSAGGGFPALTRVA